MVATAPELPADRPEDSTAGSCCRPPPPPPPLSRVTEHLRSFSVRFLSRCCCACCQQFPPAVIAEELCPNPKSSSRPSVQVSPGWRGGEEKTASPPVSISWQADRERGGGRERERERGGVCWDKDAGGAQLSTIHSLSFLLPVSLSLSLSLSLSRLDR